MYIVDESYRPNYIEFNVAHDGSNMPESFGAFETENDISKFFAEGMSTINHAVTVSRHMDQVEKSDLRSQYNDELENQLPTHEKTLSQAQHELEKAKRKVKDLTEAVNASITKIKTLAIEVKTGLKEIKLEDIYTHRIAYRGNYYSYTWIDKNLRLCKISAIPEEEKQEIWAQTEPNEMFIDKKYGNEPTETQEGS